MRTFQLWDMGTFNWRSFAIVPAMLFCASGCRQTETLVSTCVDVGSAALALSVEDSVSGARFPFTGIVAIARDGTFADSAKASTTSSSITGASELALAFNRVGTYDVEVRADGYATWRKMGIAVKAEPTCQHTITQAVRVRLVRN